VNPFGSRSWHNFEPIAIFNVINWRVRCSIAASRGLAQAIIC
jgi:hypothetical protein